MGNMASVESGKIKGERPVLKDCLDRIFPESSSDRFWLLFWAAVFTAIVGVGVCISVSVCLQAYYNRNRPITPTEEIQQELQNWNVHFERKKTQ